MPREYQYGFELRHLVYFREVAQLLHFRRAAEALAVAQPALSRQIRQLEQAMGAALLKRSSRKVELTAAGVVLRDRVEPILRSLRALPVEMRALAAGRVGQVRVGFTGLAMATVLPAILREFQRAHPGVRVELNESPTAMQLEALRAGEAACGFFHPDAATQGVRTRELLRERNGVLLPVEHGLAARGHLRLRDLDGVPLVLFPRQHNPGFYDRVLGACVEAGFSPRVVEEVWPRANAIGLVRAGIGATFVCPSEARELPPGVVFRPLKGPAPESRLVFGWREDAAGDAALAAFVGTVDKCLAGP